jgi:sugar/nucleoside kinase (ribokinase family)
MKYLLRTESLSKNMSTREDLRLKYFFRYTHPLVRVDSALLNFLALLSLREHNRFVHQFNQSPVDVVGVGINATDTVIRLPHFPTLDSKVEIISAERRAGGQTASAIAACQRWGLRTRYVGKIGDDEAGKFQQGEMDREGVDAIWLTAPGCMSQSSFILVDEKSAERTVLWKRDPHIALQPQDLRAEWIAGARVLLVDGHDTPASTQAAKWAKEAGTLVLGDFDNRYPGVEELLQYVDFAITSKDFPARLTGESDLLKSLPKMHAEFKCCLTGATLGRLGVLVWNGVKFHLCHGFRVRAVDTTGAGDIFHGAFAYGIVRSWPINEILEFSCAAAGLNCEGHGARGGIGTLVEIDRLRRRGERSEHAYPDDELAGAARAALETKLGVQI